MLPYLVTSSEDSVPLRELADGRFQMLEQGSISQFASGYKYLLLGRGLAKYVRTLKVPQITFAPAVIFNPTTREEHHSHTRVFVNQTFSPDEIASRTLRIFDLISDLTARLRSRLRRFCLCRFLALAECGMPVTTLSKCGGTMLENERIRKAALTGTTSRWNRR